MSDKAILIDVDYCTGCHSCEVACQQENDYPVGKCGIVVTEHELETNDPDRLMIYCVPWLTHFCNLCAKRTREGLLPSCVKHCQARCLEFGDIKDLAAKMQGQHKKVLCIP